MRARARTAQTDRDCANCRRSAIGHSVRRSEKSAAVPSSLAAGAGDAPSTSSAGCRCSCGAGCWNRPSNSSTCVGWPREVSHCSKRSDISEV